MTTVYASAVPAMLQMLQTLDHILDIALENAQARKIDPEVLLNARLAPDMLPLTKQIQIACDAAKFGVARSCGIDAPKFEDNESSFAEFKTRISQTLAFIKSVEPATFESAATGTVKWKSGGQEREDTALRYLRHWAMANMYFHITTAYAILRHNGVPLGKKDYLGSF